MKIKNLFLSIIVFCGIASNAATTVTNRNYAVNGEEDLPEIDRLVPFYYNTLKYKTPMYTAWQIDQLLAGVGGGCDCKPVKCKWDPDVENIRMGTNSFGDTFQIYATSSDGRVFTRVGDPQCGNVTLGANATNMNSCSVVIGKNAVGKNFGSVTIGFKTFNTDSHSVAIGNLARVVTRQNENEVGRLQLKEVVDPVTGETNQVVERVLYPTDNDNTFIPNDGLSNVGINGFVYDSLGSTAIGTTMAWHQDPNDPHTGGIYSNSWQSVAIGKQARIDNDATDSVAIGTGARVFGHPRERGAFNGTAVGAGAYAGGQYSVAIGAYANAPHDGDVVIGGSETGRIIINGRDFSNIIARLEQLEAEVATLRGLTSAPAPSARSVDEMSIEEFLKSNK